MLARIESIFHRIRRLFSRTEWIVYLLGFSKSREKSDEPGVLLIQIDGLSFSQFQAAKNKGNLPFLNHLLNKEHYQLHDFYSGLPSSTPAVQGEIHYGLKSAVPSFSFKDKNAGRIFKMYNSADAKEIQDRLEKKNKGLLEGGSSYSNIYSGGASESHFCPSSLGLAESFKNAHPLIYPLFITYILKFFRIFILLVVEWFLAVCDSIRGIIEGRNLWKELKFAPSRVALCILLRELIVIRSSVDLARGLPIVHVNFLGYDEQAHRRGPASHFAHWTLKGIDGAVARLWKEAVRSPFRHYDIFIFSDHGQEKTLPYSQLAGQSLSKSVCDALARMMDTQSEFCERLEERGIQLRRISVLGKTVFNRLFPAGENEEEKEVLPEISIADMGPLAQVYLPESWEKDSGRRLAKLLVSQYSVPSALVRQPDENDVRIYTKEEQFSLKKDIKKYLGRDHPFPEAVKEDLYAICNHPNAGALLLSGWSPNHPPVSFPVENGSHAGPGREETHGFLLTPKGSPLRKDIFRQPIRPFDLRVMIQKCLSGKNLEKIEEVSPILLKTPKTIRVMTYNIHSCIGNDGKISARRIARVIGQQQPDVVALQEVDVLRERTGRGDQAEQIADILGYQWHFEPTLSLGDEAYGIAVLSRYPIQPIQSNKLVDWFPKKKVEPRGGILIEVNHDAGSFMLLNTHLSLHRKVRKFQAGEILGSDWTDRNFEGKPLVVCGDFNTLPSSRVYRMFQERFEDSQTSLENSYPQKTWSTLLPVSRLDYIFLDKSLKIIKTTVIQSSLARRASDHFPLIVDFEIPSRSDSD